MWCPFVRCTFSATKSTKTQSLDFKLCIGIDRKSAHSWFGRIISGIDLRAFLKNDAFVRFLTCVCVCMIWMGALFVSDGEIWLASVMVTMSPFAVAAVVAMAAADVDWPVCVAVELIWLLGVIVTKFRCNANWAAILSSSFSLCRTATRLINLFFVFVSVFLAFHVGFSSDRDVQQLKIDWLLK